jgi:hypothetical protein
MAVMMVDVPEGLTVHIIVGDIASPLAPAPVTVEHEQGAPRRRRRPLLLTAAGLCILTVGFFLGHQTIPSRADADQPVASASIPASPPQPGLADNEPAAGSGAAAGEATAEPSPGSQVPASFTQQLKAPPQVTPAPGTPTGGSPPAKNPFGLGG